MKRLAIFAALLIGSFAITGCTDATMAKLGAFGDPGRVTCYSGGVLRFDDFSTGKINNSESSDGYYFMSDTTGKLVEVSGDCTIQYGVQKPADWSPTIAPAA